MAINEKLKRAIVDELEHCLPGDVALDRANNIFQAAVDGPQLRFDDIYEMITPQRGGHGGILDVMERTRSADIIAELFKNNPVTV